MNQLSRLQVMNPLSKTPTTVAQRRRLIASAAMTAVILPGCVAGATHSVTAAVSEHKSGGAASKTLALSGDVPIHVEPADLTPTGMWGQQSYAPLSPAQWSNAREIVDVVKERKMPPYAAVVSLATALQESKLLNLTVAVDHDSLGLFQQRPSCGWGLPAQLTDPKYAANAFLDALQRTVPNYQQAQLWEAAQATQQSAFPTAYAQWQDQAAQIVQHILSGKSDPS